VGKDRDERSPASAYPKFDGNSPAATFASINPQLLVRRDKGRHRSIRSSSPCTPNGQKVGIMFEAAREGSKDAVRRLADPHGDGDQFGMVLSV
jgi:hypothetical protein